MFGSMLIAGSALSASAASSHYAISAGMVAAAVSRTGIEIAPEQVTLFTAVVAATPEPSLKITSIQKLGNQQLLARLECDSTAVCIPFFASIQIAKGSAAENAKMIGPASALAVGSVQNPKSVLLRSGSVATLSLDSDHVHIRIPVICMESGSQGQTIHATDKNHRVVYSALVVNGSLLKGKL